MTLKPFFTYYGGKWRAAPHYPPPRYGKICEPFAGSAGYSLRYADRQVVLCDLDPVIYGVWSFLIRSSPADIRALPLIGAGESVDQLSVCQEARWLIGFRLNGGSASPCKTPSSWMRSNTRPNSYWGAAVRERIASQVDAIKHWKVGNVSFDRIKASEDLTWFVDPPYNNRMGEHYRRGRAGIDYVTLASWCRARTGQVIVCENTGADWLPFRHMMNAQATPAKPGKPGGNVSAEAIWTNDHQG